MPIGTWLSIRHLQRTEGARQERCGLLLLSASIDMDTEQWAVQKALTVERCADQPGFQLQEMIEDAIIKDAGRETIGQAPVIAPPSNPAQFLVTDPSNINTAHLLRDLLILLSFHQI